jgi:predicted phage terminase large subunit-like protein
MLARPQLTPDIAQRYLDEIDTELARRAAKRMEAGRFLDFCRDPDLFQEYPVFYHEDLCATLQRIESGEIKRAMFFLPPGAAKSTYGSVRFPCWYLGRNPSKRVIHGCNVKELAEDFGRKVRNLIASRDFRAVFPEVVLSSDSAAAGRWDLGAGGGYYGVGRGGAVTGRRADLAILDDVIKGREEADSETVREKAWQWYLSDLRTRLKPDGAIVIIMTRWHPDDLAGRILPETWSGQSGWVRAKDGEQWFVINLPMEAEQEDYLGREVGELLRPDYWTRAWVDQEKAIQGTRNWNALFQGHPTTEEGAIIKTSMWRKWPCKQPPIVDYIVQSIDGAFEEDEDADYSARTTWGVFDIFRADNARVLQAIWKDKKRHEVQRYHAILLEAWRGKVPFSVFKRNVQDSYKQYEPDRLLIEKKASGISLIQELRKSGLPVKAVLPDRSKKSRAHAAEIPFEQGCIWYVDLPWVQPVIRECAQFPNGEYDDWVDTVTQAIIWMRKTYHLEFQDEDEEPVAKRTPRPIYG